MDRRPHTTETERGLLTIEETFAFETKDNQNFKKGIWPTNNHASTLLFVNNTGKREVANDVFKREKFWETSINICKTERRLFLKLLCYGIKNA